MYTGLGNFLIDVADGKKNAPKIVGKGSGSDLTISDHIYTDETNSSKSSLHIEMAILITDNLSESEKFSDHLDQLGDELGFDTTHLDLTGYHRKVD